MPGLSLIYRDDLDRNLALSSLLDLKHEPYYVVGKLVDNNSMMSVFSGYDGYPRQVLEYDSTVIFVEGLIYNRSESDIEASLIAISKSYAEDSDYKALITQFIDTSDGDFNVLICSKSGGRFVIFNDRWGRLPSYFYYDGDMFVFSRELKFILHFIPSIEFDRVSVAEFLLFEFVLGQRTLVKGVSRMSPSCVLDVEPSGSRVKVEVNRLFGLNFEDAKQTLSKDECIEECKNLLLQSVNDRVRKVQGRQYNITADLSGGFDTRAVFGTLCKTGAKVDYYTEELVTGDESEYALKVASLFGKEVTRITASHEMKISDMSRVTYLTDCTVNGWTALVSYRDEAERAKQVKGVSVRFAGLGGCAFIKRIPKARKGYKTLTDMMKTGHLVGIGSVERICAVAKLDERTFCNHLTEYFDEYPESTLRGKVRHWHFEYENTLVSFGEDRGRLRIWPVEPFWSNRFFSYATMRIPEEYVDRVGFYFRFLRAIDPNLLNAPFFGGGKIVTNSRLSCYRGYLLNGIRDILLRMSRSSKIVRELLKRYRRRSLIKDSNERERIKRDILENYATLNKLCTFSDEKRISRFMEDAARARLYRLLTLVLYFKEIESRYGNKACVK